MPLIHTASPLTDVPGLLEEISLKWKSSLWASGCSFQVQLQPMSVWGSRTKQPVMLFQRRRERNARLEPVQVTHCTGATQATAVANWAELKCCRCVMVFPNTSWELDSHHAATSALTVGTRGPAVIGQSGGILEEKPRGFLRSTAHYNKTSAINPSADYHARLILSYFLPPSMFLCVVVFLLLF